MEPAGSPSLAGRPCPAGRGRHRRRPGVQILDRRCPCVGFADPDARLGFAYVMNNMEFHMFDDPREKALRDAVHRAIRRLSD